MLNTNYLTKIKYTLFENHASKNKQKEPLLADHEIEIFYQLFIETRRKVYGVATRRRRQNGWLVRMLAL